VLSFLKKGWGISRSPLVFLSRETYYVKEHGDVFFCHALTKTLWQTGSNWRTRTETLLDIGSLLVRTV